MTLLAVRVVSPVGELNKFNARSVSSANSAGKFDILPGHANFVTYISGKKLEIVLEDKSKIQLEYPVAVVKVWNDKVDIFVDVEAFQNL